MRRWFAVSVLVTTGVMVNVASAGTITSSLIVETPGLFVATTPDRILDTRPAPNGPIGVPTSGKLGPNSAIDIVVAGDGRVVPANATAAMINITVDQDANLQSFLTVWPTGEPRPLTSANNAQPGLIAANSMIAALGANGSISIYNQQGSVNVVIDVVGYLVAADGGTGSGLLVGTGPPGSDIGSDGDYYLDASTHILYGPKVDGEWPATGSDLGGLRGGVNRFNTAVLNVPIPTTAPTAIPFALAGPVFGTFAPPTTPATATTYTVGADGIFEVEYRLDAAATGVGVIQVYVNNTPFGPGTNISAVATLASDTVLAPANAGDEIELRFTGAVGFLTTTNTSSIVITQISST